MSNVCRFKSSVRWRSTTATFSTAKTSTHQQGAIDAKPKGALVSTGGFRCDGPSRAAPRAQPCMDLKLYPPPYLGGRGDGGRGPLSWRWHGCVDRMVDNPPQLATR